ncbi:hypothetical protein C9374_011849 [Naegleria lovaniensis]|uniref:Uncharacterized protein n=1 Tax=Naegleria lovaniensis TaxID=51637 RepID=A0AA88KCD2_NAELO|nr:uncharacterized protein C9374_011849 [Naegleria lovaniensis]KAG2373760.1 hypothetical protein C9374_011849 [Naegleria lovaniensis]
MSSSSQPLLDIIQKYPLPIMSKISASLVEDICDFLNIVYGSKVKAMERLGEAYSFPEENPDGLSNTASATRMEKELTQFFKSSVNEPPASQAEPLTSHDPDVMISGAKKRKAEEDNARLHEEIKKLKSSVELLLNQVSKSDNGATIPVTGVSLENSSLSSNLAKRDSNVQPVIGIGAESQNDLLVKLWIESNVNEYIDKTFKPIATVSQAILAEYESLKSTARAAMKILLRHPDCEDARTLVSNCEKRGFNLHLTALNPKVASELSLINNNPLWKENTGDVALAYKIAEMKRKYNYGEKKEQANNYHVNLLNKAQSSNKEDSNGHNNNVKEKPKLPKLCHICQSPNHLAANCDKRNKKDGSLYSFFHSSRRNNGKESCNSFHFQQMVRMAEKRSATSDGHNVERRSEGCYFQKLPEVSWESRYFKVDQKGARMVQEGNCYVKGNWSHREDRQSRSNCKISFGSEERFVPFNNRSSTTQSILSNSEIQVQDSQEVSRICTEKWFERLWIFVRHEEWLSPDKGASRFSQIFCNRSRWRNISVYSTSLWMEWISVYIHTSDESICILFGIKYSTFVKLFGRYWFTTFWRFRNSSKEFSDSFERKPLSRDCDGKEKEFFDTNETIPTLRDIDRFRTEETVYDRFNDHEDQRSNTMGFRFSKRFTTDYMQRSVQNYGRCCCLLRLFSTSSSYVESYLFIRDESSVNGWMGSHFCIKRQRCAQQPKMDFRQLRFLEWETISIPKSCELFLDGCVLSWLGSLFQRRKFEITRYLERFRKRSSYQYFRSEKYLDCLNELERIFPQKESNYLHRFDGGFKCHKERKSQERDYEQDCSRYLEDYLRKQYSTVVVGVASFLRECNSRSTEQNERRSRSDRLGDHSRSIQPSSAAVECLNRFRSIRLPLQFQSGTLLYKDENVPNRSGGCFQSFVERASNQLVLCSLQPGRKSTTTLPGIQSSNGLSASSVENKVVVEPRREVSGKTTSFIWARFRSHAERKRGTTQEILENRGNVNRLSMESLRHYASLIIPCHIKDTTSNNYDSYWFRMIDFAVKNGFTPPPSVELVVVFLTDLFLQTPSGSNCRAASFAIRNRCKLYMVEDPTSHPQVEQLISGMCNLSMVASERERSPWSIEFIKKWIDVGSSFVSNKIFVMYTALMIIGIRTMFRGSELGGLLLEDIKLVSHPVIGFKITARTTKNNPRGRTACIEATGSPLCPLRWLKRLLEVRDQGKYLFTGSHEMNTVEVSWILKQIAIWIGEDGKYSSHSLRIGGATEASFAKFSEAAIKAIGDWSSNAVDRYFRSEFSGERNVSQQLGL